MGKVAILGLFNADCAFRAERPPRMGETLMGKSFVLGPGGKGSNQAVAAARAGAETHFISKLGADAFADLARAAWAEAGVIPEVAVDPESHTGAAYIFVEDATGDNAIIVAAGAGERLMAEDVEEKRAVIEGADVFLTQLEQPMEAAIRGLEIAKAAGVRTVLNPAPAADLPEGVLALCDLVTPNESEAEALTGLKVRTPDEAAAAAEALMARGAGAVVVTMGEAGALYVDGETRLHVPALSAGPVVETTGAGDAFSAGLATALSEGQDIEAALRFATATAGLSVTKRGSAPSMPMRAEIEAALARG